MILCRPIAKICVAILWRDPIPLSLLHLDWLFDQWIISDIDNGGGGGGNDEYTTKSPASTSRRGSVLFSGNEAIHHQKRRVSLNYIREMFTMRFC